MARFTLTLLLTICCIASCLADLKISGRVTDATGNRIIGATVKVLNADNKLVAYAISNNKGDYHASIASDSIAATATVVSFSCLGYETKNMRVKAGTPVQHINVSLNEKAFELKEVVVKIPPIHNVGDTIVYNVGAFASKSDRTIEDVIKRLPGIEVKSNGQIHYNGNPINKFYIEGLDLLGGRYAIATKNISPDDIQSVDVYENHQPKQALKNIRISNRAGLNLTLKKGRAIKPTGHLKGGVGYGDNRTNWIADFFMLQAAAKQQTLLSAKGNSTGQRISEAHSLTGSSSANRFMPNSIFSSMPFGSASIPSSRYFFNQTAYASANTIRKIKKDLTFNATADYTYEADKYTNSAVTTYWAEQPITVAENNASHLASHVAKMSLKVENNSPKLYIANTTNARASFVDNQHQLSQNLSIGQSQRTNNIALSNNFNTVINTGSKAYEIKSVLSLINTPLNYIDAVNTGTGTQIVHQSAKGLSFHTAESTSFTWPITQKMHWGTSLMFDASYNNFRPDNSLQNNSHKISGYKITTSVAPYIQYSHGRFTWRTDVPIRLHDLNYSGNSFHKPYLDLTSTADLRIGHFTRSSLSISRTYGTGTISDFITDTIYTTYRQTRVLGSGHLSINRTDRIALDANYRHVRKGTFASLRLMYSRNKYNSLSATDASQQATGTSQLFLSNYGTNISLNASFSQRIDAIGTTAGISGSLLDFDRQSQKQGIITSICNRAYTINVNAKSTLLNDNLQLNASLSYGHTAQKAPTLNTSTATNDISLTARASCFPIKALEIYCEANYMRQSQANVDEVRKCTFLDAGIIFTHKKTEWQLSARNLTNQRSYEYTVIRTIDTYKQAFDLRPLELLLTAKYKF